MTQDEYEKAQARLPRAYARAVTEGQALIREALLPQARAALTTGKIDTDGLTRALYDIITKQAAKPAALVSEIENRFIMDAAAAAGIRIKERNAADAGSPLAWDERLKRWYEATGKSMGKLTQPVERKREGYAFEGYYKRPDGQMVFVTRDRVQTFLQKYKLSGETRPLSVWDITADDVRGIEKRIFDVIEGGRALGRDAKDIALDLEQYIKHNDGGQRVIGRWLGMVSPYNADGSRNQTKIRQGWEREYIDTINKELPADQHVFFGSEEAKTLLQDPSAQAWIQDHRISKKTGRELLPPSARRYVGRLGKAGLDYRAVRVLRTETAVSLNERQKLIAQNSPASTGKVLWILAQTRDAWDCECADAARRSKVEGGWTIGAFPNGWDVPLHPNCSCELRPMSEVAANLRREFGVD